MRIVRIIAWSMFGLAAVLLIGSVALAFSYAHTYGWPDRFAELASQQWWLAALVGWPAAVGWLLLRIAHDETQ